MSDREKKLLLLLGAVAVVFLLYFTIQGLTSSSSDRPSSPTAGQETLDKVRAYAEELTRLKSMPKTVRLTQPLIGSMERLAKKIGVDDRIQLNAISSEKDIEIVEAKVDSLTLDQMVVLVHAVENNTPPLVIDQFEMTRSFRSKSQLRVTLRVMAQK